MQTAKNLNCEYRDRVYYFGDNGDVVDEYYKEMASRYLKIKEINEKNIDEILETEKITKILYMNDDAMILDNIQQELKKTYRNRGVNCCKLYRYC